MVAIQLGHLEQWYRDPTSDEILHLMCRGIKWLQGDGNSHSHCPIAINLLCMVKTQVSRSSLYILSGNNVYYGLPSL